jgi:hypothetical protein
MDMAIAPIAETTPKDENFSHQSVQEALINLRPGTRKADAAVLATLVMEAQKQLLRQPAIHNRSLMGKVFAKAVKQAMETIRLEQANTARAATSAEPTMYKGLLVEHSQGQRLGKVLTRKESAEMLRSIGSNPPLESWAGPVLGPVEIERQLGIPRSTLSAWHAANIIIGIKRGMRRHEYPVEQFIDGRPLEGIDQILKIAPTARAAWMWLRSTRDAFDSATPLQMLELGKVSEVVEDAHRDFDPG